MRQISPFGATNQSSPIDHLRRKYSLSPSVADLAADPKVELSLAQSMITFDTIN
jgi:hypothetical protein